MKKNHGKWQKYKKSAQIYVEYHIYMYRTNSFYMSSLHLFQIEKSPPPSLQTNTYKFSNYTLENATSRSYKFKHFVRFHLTLIVAYSTETLKSVHMPSHYYLSSVLFILLTVRFAFVWISVWHSFISKFKQNIS